MAAKFFCFPTLLPSHIAPTLLPSYIAFSVRRLLGVIKVLLDDDYDLLIRITTQSNASVVTCSIRTRAEAHTQRKCGNGPHVTLTRVQVRVCVCLCICVCVCVCVCVCDDSESNSELISPHIHIFSKH